MKRVSIVIFLVCAALYLSGCPDIADYTVEPPDLREDPDSGIDSPSSWGSGEGILDDGTVPGEISHRRPEREGASPSDWGSGGPILDDGTVPGEDSGADERAFRKAADKASKIYTPKVKRQVFGVPDYVIEGPDIEKDYGFYPVPGKPKDKPETASDDSSCGTCSQ
jgi:hypothetical protein